MSEILLVALAVALAAVLALVGAFFLRRRFLLSGLGAVTMWARPPGRGRWSVGVAWYGGDTLLWYRALSFAVRPNHRLSRSELLVESRRPAGPDDPDDTLVLLCRTGEGTRELAMDQATVTGFLSWVESAPPVR